MLSQGQMLNNHYRIVRVITQSDTGIVYRGWDLNLNHACAIKEIIGAGIEAQQQFQQEAQVLSGLSHPNLSQVLDSFSIPDQGNYLVMELVEGTDLQSEIQKNNRPINQRDLIPWMTQICDALIYLHSQIPPVIHREIKPANIRITGEGRAVLVDYGFSQVVTPMQKPAENQPAVPDAFMAYETWSDGVTDVRTDIYALGATLYTLLCAEEPPDCLSRFNGAPLPNLRSLNDSITPEMEEILSRSMAIFPGGRYQNVTEMQNALKAQAGATVIIPELATPQTTIPAPVRYDAIPPQSTSPTYRAYEPPPQPPQKAKGKSCLVWGGIIAGVLVFLGIVLAIALAVLAPSILPFFGNKEVVEATYTPEPKNTKVPTKVPATATPQPDFYIQPAYDGTPNPQKGYANLGDICSHADDPVLTPKTYSYTCTVPADIPIVINMGWCASTQEILEQNWALMTYTLTIDGISFDINDATAFMGYTNSQGYCYTYRSYVEGLKSGEHDITYSFSMSEPLYDGFDNYQAGDYILQHLVTIP
ncbi:MAG: serine/threonine-protein kinase [Anaerolineaceae bacterium]